MPLAFYEHLWHVKICHTKSLESKHHEMGTKPKSNPEPAAVDMTSYLFLRLDAANNYAEIHIFGYPYPRYFYQSIINWENQHGYAVDKEIHCAHSAAQPFC